MAKSPRRANKGLRAAKKANRSLMLFLKFHRYRLGLNQAQLAKRIGIAQSTYCSYERGAKRPSPKHNTKLAAALGRPVEEVTAKIHNVDLAEVGYSQPHN